MTTAVDTRGIHGPAVERVEIKDVLDKLKTMDQVREAFAATEPLTSVPLRCGESNTKFRMNKGWNYEAEKIMADETVEVFMTVGQNEYQLTRDALYEMTSNMGMTTAYVTKTPAALIEPHLNFWYGKGITDKDYKAFVRDGQVLAVAKSTIDPFSNLRFLDEALAAVENKYGEGEIYADYKFEHSLRQTSLRLIVPESLRTIEDTGTEMDSWSAGVQFRNSLIGASKTAIDGYLFRYWCSNGALDTFASTSETSWNRKAGQGDEFFEWARQTVDDVLGGLEHTLDKVQEMVYVNVDDGVIDIAKEIFKENRLSGPARDIVVENLANSQNLNMYAVMQSITAAANHPDLDPRHVDALMQAGGSMVHMSHARCNECRQFVHNHTEN